MDVAGTGGYERLDDGVVKCADDAAPPRKWNARQWILLVVLSLATLTSSFAICLFPPFFPKIVSLSCSFLLGLFFVTLNFDLLIGTCWMPAILGKNNQWSG